MAFYITNLLCVILVVTVHEFGHFYFARRYGLVPPEFAIGFGPALIRREFRGTTLALRSIPFGGFVKMNPGDLDSLDRRQRIMVYFGGPLANLVLSVLIAVIGVSIGLVPERFAELPFVILLLLAVVGTVALFFVGIPLTIYLLVDIFLRPFESLETVSGPIGVLSGSWVPEEMMHSFSFLEVNLIIIWIISLSVGTMNLLPLSFLDGGHIFHELFAKFPRFVKGWRRVTNVVLLALVLYMIGGDIYKLF